MTSIQPGVDNKASVEKMLGRPSFTGEFTPNEWYYVSRDVQQIAFRNPRVTDQTVLHVSFDPKGNVTAVEPTGQGAGDERQSREPHDADAGPVERSFFDELFGNIGRSARRPRRRRAAAVRRSRRPPLPSRRTFA